jgi:hypothetical protein
VIFDPKQKDYLITRRTFKQNIPRSKMAAGGKTNNTKWSLRKV